MKFHWAIFALCALLAVSVRLVRAEEAIDAETPMQLDEQATEVLEAKPSELMPLEVNDGDVRKVIVMDGQATDDAFEEQLAKAAEVVAELKEPGMQRLARELRQFHNFQAGRNALADSIDEMDAQADEDEAIAEERAVRRRKRVRRRNSKNKVKRTNRNKLVSKRRQSQRRRQSNRNSANRKNVKRVNSKRKRNRKNKNVRRRQTKRKNAGKRRRTPNRRMKNKRNANKKRNNMQRRSQKNRPQKNNLSRSKQKPQNEENPNSPRKQDEPAENMAHAVEGA